MTRYAWLVEHRSRQRRVSFPRGMHQMERVWDERRGQMISRYVEPEGVRDAIDREAAPERAIAYWEDESFAAVPGTVGEYSEDYCPNWRWRLYRHAGRAVLGPCGGWTCRHCGPLRAQTLLGRTYRWLGDRPAIVSRVATRGQAEDFRDEHGGGVVLRQLDGWVVVCAGRGGLENAARDRELVRIFLGIPREGGGSCPCLACGDDEAGLPNAVNASSDADADRIVAALAAEGARPVRYRRGISWDPSAVDDNAWGRIVRRVNPVAADVHAFHYIRGPDLAAAANF